MHTNPELTLEQKWMLEQFLLDHFPDNAVVVMIQAQDTVHTLKNCSTSCQLTLLNTSIDAIIEREAEERGGTVKEFIDKTKNQNPDAN